MSIFLITIMSLVVVLADYLLKMASQKPSIWNYYFLFGMMLYTSTAYLWMQILKSTKFASANIIYSLCIIILSVGVGVFHFKDQLGMIEIVAIISAIFSIVVLSRFA